MFQKREEFRIQDHAVFDDFRQPAPVFAFRQSFEVCRIDPNADRLMKRPDGSPRCVACFMCSTACPARCIIIIAEEAPDKHIEKRPVRFEIDLLLCVFCGYCVEACPCDAIRMDTKQAVLAGDNRADFVVNKESLMEWKPTDYPADDTQSQKAPGGSLHTQALAEFKSGTYH